MSFVYKRQDHSDDSDIFTRWIPLGTVDNFRKLLYQDKLVPHKFDIGTLIS